MRTIMAAAAALVGVALFLHACGQAQEGKGAVVELDGLKSAVPSSWVKEKPSSNLRLYQFRIPKELGDERDAELRIFHFGKGGGGDVKANIDRWKGMFRAPKGKTLDEVATVKEFKVGNVPVTYLDVRGTYLEKFPPFAPNAKTIMREDYRMFGVILASDNGPFFITMTGPAKTLEKHKEGFDNWLKAFK